MRKTILVDKEIEVLVVSSGGVGTTFLMKHLSKYVNINDFNNIDGFKHIPIPVFSLNKNLKVIYVFGDPVMACISLFRRRYHYAHTYQMNKYLSKIKVLPIESSIEEYVQNKMDGFYMLDHFSNWSSKLNTHRTLFVRYESLYEHVRDIQRFLNLDDDFVDAFPDKRKRLSNTDGIDVQLVSGLKKIYQSGALKDEKRNAFVVNHKRSLIGSIKKLFSNTYRRSLINFLRLLWKK